MGAVPAEAFAEPFYCFQHGELARAGLDVEIVTFSGGNTLQQAMAGNAIDVGIVDIIQISNAINHGLRYQYFAGSSLMTSKGPTTLLCTSAKSNVRSAKDLEGQTIGVVTLHSVNELAVREWVRRSGFDESALHFVELNGPAMVPGLVRGTVAAAMVFEPYLSAARDDIRRLGNPYPAIADEFLLNAWYARTDWLQANAAIMPRMIRAIYDTARWANRNHNATAPLFAGFSKMDLTQVSAMTRATYATSLDVRLLEPVVNVAMKYRAIEKTVPASDLVFQPAL